MLMYQCIGKWNIWYVTTNILLNIYIVAVVLQPAMEGRDGIYYSCFTFTFHIIAENLISKVSYAGR
jgi:hypothetical protein